MYNKGPFATWVPKPLMLLLIILFMIPTLAISGVYVSNSNDISGALATYNEFIALANNASAIGMGVCMLIVLRIKMRFRTKEIVVSTTVILALLSLMNGTTDNVYVIVVNSFLIGFFKILLMIEVILPLMFIISPTGDRGRFYSVFYPISIGMVQISSYFFARAISESNYQSPYYIMAICMLSITVLSLIFQHNSRFSFKTPLYQIDWLSILLISISAMCFNAFFTFMKQQGWFISPYIKGSLILGILFLFLTVYRQKFLKRKMFKFDIFYKKSNVRHSILLLLFFGLFLSSSSIVSQYTVGVLGYNSLINAQLNLWTIFGIVLAGAYAFFSFKYNWNIKFFISAGFLSFFIHTLILYLIIQPTMNMEYLEYTMILKGLGMGILFIGIWFYASLGLAMNDLFSVMSILLMFRSFLITAIGGAIIGWASYLGQWQSLTDMAVYLDMGDIQNQLIRFQDVNVNALMASSKLVLGALCWMIIPILTLILTHSYGKFNYRRLVLMRKVYKRNSLKGYRM